MGAHTYTHTHIQGLLQLADDDLMTSSLSELAVLQVGPPSSPPTPPPPTIHSGTSEAGGQCAHELMPASFGCTAIS
eukprot:1149302-Pelagomonas_calceolata.AAC.4